MNKLAIAPVLTACLLLGFCSGPKPPALSPQKAAAFTEAGTRAERLFAAGNYASLSEACAVLLPFCSDPSLRKKAGPRFIKTALMLTLREKELGILHHENFREASFLAEEDPDFSSFLPYLEIVEHIRDSTKGVIGLWDETDSASGDEQHLEDYFEWLNQRITPLIEWLEERATSTDFDAYLYLTLYSEFAFKFDEKTKKEDFEKLHALFPESRLLGFKMRIHPSPDARKLEEWLEDNPDFVEAHLYLGDIALSEGRVLTAERHYLEAFAALPDSTSLAISLSKVYFHSEELDQSLEYNDKALALAPQYRDALLGRAMCLAYLGRCAESLEALDRMLVLGKYYIGETYYWKAWNLNELERLEEAREAIDNSRHYLYGHGEVSTLDGIISYKQHLLDDAEQDFLEALGLSSSDCDAAYWLGKVYADKGDWAASGRFFEQGAACCGKTEQNYEAKISEIESSSMAPSRKEALIRRKKLQILQLRNTRFTCFFNAAAGFFNAGLLDRALELAERSAAHPKLKEGAARLIEGIKNRKSP